MTASLKQRGLERANGSGVGRMEGRAGMAMTRSQGRWEERIGSKET
jgi:hypothetical protein